jgi:peptidoglycan hydrolase FlgJ
VVIAVSINPVSDIVLDVARSADPFKSRVAAEKLSRGNVKRQAASSDFSHLLVSTSTMPQISGNSLGEHGTESSNIKPQNARVKAYKGLEQLVLKNLLENMLPKESGTFFGTGTAGDIWRSFLADQLATQVGKTVNLGLDRQPKEDPIQSEAKL